MRTALLAVTLFMAAARASIAQGYTVIDVTPPGLNAAATSAVVSGPAQFAGAVYTGTDFTFPNAAIWNGITQDYVNLHPTDLLDMPSINGVGRSTVTGTSGTTQVGYGSGPTTFQQIVALAWTGTAGSAAVLQAPFASQQSQALGIGGGQIVGYAFTRQSVGGRGTVHFFAGPPHALLWDEATRSVVDLHNGAQGTVATAASGENQVGYGGSFPATTYGAILDQPKAMLWQGHAANFVWLHPTKGYQSSAALTTDGVLEAGWAQQLGAGGKLGAQGATHAALWAHTAASFVDLHPAGFAGSIVLANCGGKQAGYAVDAAGTTHAIVWSGSAVSAIDLNQYLPAGFTAAQATAIDPAGNISGVMFSANQRHAIVWSPAGS